MPKLLGLRLPWQWSCAPAASCVTPALPGQRCTRPCGVPVARGAGQETPEPRSFLVGALGEGLLPLCLSFLA